MASLPGMDHKPAPMEEPESREEWFGEDANRHYLKMTALVGAFSLALSFLWICHVQYTDGSETILFRHTTPAEKELANLAVQRQRVELDALRNALASKVLCN